MHITDFEYTPFDRGNLISRNSSLESSTNIIGKVYKYNEKQCPNPVGIFEILILCQKAVGSCDLCDNDLPEIRYRPCGLRREPPVSYGAH